MRGSLVSLSHRTSQIHICCLKMLSFTEYYHMGVGINFGGMMICRLVHFCLTIFLVPFSDLVMFVLHLRLIGSLLESGMYNKLTREWDWQQCWLLSFFMWVLYFIMCTFFTRSSLRLSLSNANGMPMECESIVLCALSSLYTWVGFFF